MVPANCRGVVAAGLGGIAAIQIGTRRSGRNAGHRTGVLNDTRAKHRLGATVCRRPQVEIITGGDEYEGGKTALAVGLHIVKQRQAAIGPADQHHVVEILGFDHGSNIVGPGFARHVVGRILRLGGVAMAAQIEGNQSVSVAQITFEL